MNPFELSSYNDTILGKPPPNARQFPLAPRVSEQVIIIVDEAKMSEIHEKLIAVLILVNYYDFLIVKN